MEIKVSGENSQLRADVKRTLQAWRYEGHEEDIPRNVLEFLLISQNHDVLVRDEGDGTLVVFPRRFERQ